MTMPISTAHARWELSKVFRHMCLWLDANFQRHPPIPNEGAVYLYLTYPTQYFVK